MHFKFDEKELLELERQTYVKGDTTSSELYGYIYDLQSRIENLEDDHYSFKLEIKEIINTHQTQKLHRFETVKAIADLIDPGLFRNY